MDNFYLQTENICFTATVILYVVTMVLLLLDKIGKKEHAGTWGMRAFKLGFVLHTLAMVCRGIGAGRVPLSNQYEFATAFAWGIALFFIIYERKPSGRDLGVFITPLAILLIGYAAMLNKEVRPLMPALQSGWLAIHVSLAILSYGSFALACALAGMYLSQYDKKGPEGLKTVDENMYRAIVIGYILLTLCILTGSLWAQKAWGRYWAWDPKETWSLITWLIYTAYLHMRKVKGMKDKRAAQFAVIGFLCVIFTYIGVNNLLPSLHSYK